MPISGDFFGLQTPAFQGERRRRYNWLPVWSFWRGPSLVITALGGSQSQPEPPAATQGPTPMSPTDLVHCNGPGSDHMAAPHVGRDQLAAPSPSVPDDRPLQPRLESWHLKKVELIKTKKVGDVSSSEFWPSCRLRELQLFHSQSQSWRCPSARERTSSLAQKLIIPFRF